MVTLQVAERSWPVKLLSYRNRSRLTSGWRVFAEENSLQADDMCSRNASRIKVTLRKPSLMLQLSDQTRLSLHRANSSLPSMFARLESAFAQSGQRSPFQLQYHISPARVSIEAFKTLPYGARIPTFLSNRPLIIISVKEFRCPDVYQQCLDAKLRPINNVLMQNLIVFDDGVLIIYGVNGLFDSSFKIFSCSPVIPRFDVDSYDQASNLLMSRGYTKFTTFLDLQL
ncbi:hypothetical protein DITRI_Ditri09bG0008800 [Diplodiscus trichospermus]